MTTIEFARLAIETLDAQRAFSRSRSPADLDAVKGLEWRLRRAAETFLDRGPTIPGFIDERQ